MNLTHPPEQTKDFQDAALLVVAHGSSQNSGSASSARQHAAELRKRGIFAEVSECFLQQEPRLSAALAGVRAERIFAVPLFISEGYFTREIIPAALGFGSPGEEGYPPLKTPDGRTVHYCSPVGTHPRITEVLLRLASAVMEKHPVSPVPCLGEITLCIAGHGTRRNPDSRKAIERQVERIKARRVFSAVQGLFIEEEPSIARCYELAATRDIILLPFFISDGLHVAEDIPMLLGEEKAGVRERLLAGVPAWRNPTERLGHRVWCAEAVGTAAGIADLILDRVRESAAMLSASEFSPPSLPG